MHQRRHSSIQIQNRSVHSHILERELIIDVYLPFSLVANSTISLLLVNDGQDLPTINFDEQLDRLISSGNIRPVLCVGIYAGNRMMEYGTNGITDFAGRGAHSNMYQRFLVEELIPLLHKLYAVANFDVKSIAGFSLGGLSALDTLWSYPNVFSIAGVFSGSLWWRSRDLTDGYVEERDRIMHRKIRKGPYRPGLQFYFTTGSLDETADRNNNGIIDSIDDTLTLIDELKKIGFSDEEIKYINYEDGRHDLESWGKAMPQFLLWAFNK